MKHPVKVEYDFTGQCGCDLCCLRREMMKTPGNLEALEAHLGGITRREFILMHTED